MTIISLLLKYVIQISYYINIIDNNITKYLPISPLVSVIIIYCIIFCFGIATLSISHGQKAIFEIERNKVIKEEANYVPTTARLSQELKKVKNEVQLFNNKSLVIKRITPMISHHASVCENMQLELLKNDKSYFKSCDAVVTSLCHGNDIERITKSGVEFKFLLLSSKGIFYLDRDRKMTAVQYSIQELKHILLFNSKTSPSFQLVFTNKTLKIRSALGITKTMDLYQGFQSLIKRLKVDSNYDLWEKIQASVVKRRSSAKMVPPTLQRGDPLTPTRKIGIPSGGFSSPDASPIKPIYTSPSSLSIKNESNIRPKLTPKSATKSPRKI